MSAFFKSCLETKSLGKCSQGSHQSFPRVLSLKFALFSQSLDLRRQAPDVDEALGLCLVIVALAEGNQFFAVERIGAGRAGGDDVALVGLQLCLFYTSGVAGE